MNANNITVWESLDTILNTEGSGQTRQQKLHDKQVQIR